MYKTTLCFLDVVLGHGDVMFGSRPPSLRVVFVSLDRNPSSLCQSFLIKKMAAKMVIK